MWDKVFKNGTSKICGWQPSKNFECFQSLNTLSKNGVYTNNLQSWPKYHDQVY